MLLLKMLTWNNYDLVVSWRCFDVNGCDAAGFAVDDTEEIRVDIARLVLGQKVFFQIWKKFNKGIMEWSKFFFTCLLCLGKERKREREKERKREREKERKRERERKRDRMKYG